MPSGVLWSPSILLAPTGTVPSATLYVFRTFSPLRSVMVRADFTTTILDASSLSSGRARAASRTRARMQQRCDSERGLVRNVFFVDAERPEVRIGNLAKDGSVCVRTVPLELHGMNPSIETGYPSGDYAFRPR